MNNNGILARFVAVPFTVVGALVITALLTEFVAYRLRIWNEPVTGFACACVVVLTAFWCAPTAKILTGLISLIIGATVAWILLKHSYYPEPHPKAYEPTMIPLICTLAGGVFSFVVLTFIEIRKRKT